MSGSALAAEPAKLVETLQDLLKATRQLEAATHRTAQFRQPAASTPKTRWYVSPATQNTQTPTPAEPPPVPAPHNPFPQAAAVLLDLSETVITAFKTGVKTLCAIASDITGNPREARLAAGALVRLRLPDSLGLAPHPTGFAPHTSRAPRNPAPAPRVAGPSPAPAAPGQHTASRAADSAPLPSPRTAPAPAVSVAPPAPLHVAPTALRAPSEPAAVCTAHPPPDDPPAFTPDPLYARCGADLPESPAAALLAAVGSPCGREARGRDRTARDRPSAGTPPLPATPPARTVPAHR